MIFGYTAGQVIFGSLLAIEMISFNMLTIDSCCQRKYSRWFTALTTCLFTVVIIVLTMLVLKPGARLMVETGNGIVLLVGWFYVPFCQLLYSGRFMRKVGIVFTTWSYTYFVYYMSVALVSIFEPSTMLMHMLIVQSIIYAVSGVFFIRFIRRVYVKMLNSLNNSNEIFLTIVTGIWFATIIAGSQAFMFKTLWLDITLATLVGANCILSYALYCRLSSSEIKKEELEKLAYTDGLSNLYNRTKLFIDANKMIASRTKFTLIFADINYLKHINDTFGHSYGDKYLTLFSSKATKVLGDAGTMYRMSGDEFVCIFTGSDEHREVYKMALRNQLWMDTHPTVRYYGCGIGEAHYPADGDNMDALLKAADVKMYADKKINKPPRFEP